MKKKEEFEGFEFETKIDSLKIDMEKAEIYDDGTPATGDVYKVDNFFDEVMIKASKELFSIVSNEDLFPKS